MSDGECTSAPATVSIEVRPGNDGPSCVIVAGPLLKVTPEVTENIVLSCDNLTAAVVLDGTLSSDPEGDGLTYVWTVDGMPAGTDAMVTAVLDVGTHEVTLTVSDGGGSGPCPSGSSSTTCTTTVTVIDGCEAVEELVLLVEQNGATIGDSLQKTLTKKLKDACKKFAKGKCKEGVKELVSFQDKVRHHDEQTQRPSKKTASAKNQIDHETAVLLIEAAQAVIDGFEPCDCMEP